MNLSEIQIILFRAAQRAFWGRRKDDAAKSVVEHMSASQAFSFLKFYQHSS